jgi:formiminotetrahydrofolate cyclodeaminase
MAGAMQTFLENLASPEPVPGGGSAAAVQAAMGGALLVMVSNLTVGRKRYEDVKDAVTSVRDRAAQLMHQAQVLESDDEAAYRAVASCFALPRETEHDKMERSRRMQEALKGAVEPPLRIMEVASDVARLAGELVEIGNRSAVSDVGTAVLAARAAYRAARLNVDINLQSIRDLQWSEEVRRRCDAIADPEGIEAVVLGRVEALISGHGG